MLRRYNNSRKENGATRSDFSGLITNHRINTTKYWCTKKEMCIFVKKK